MSQCLIWVGRCPSHSHWQWSPFHCCLCRKTVKADESACLQVSSTCMNNASIVDDGQVNTSLLWSGDDGNKLNNENDSPLIIWLIVAYKLFDWLESVVGVCAQVNGKYSNAACLPALRSAFIVLAEQLTIWLACWLSFLCLAYRGKVRKLNINAIIMASVWLCYVVSGKIETEYREGEACIYLREPTNFIFHDQRLWTWIIINILFYRTAFLILLNPAGWRWAQELHLQSQKANDLAKHRTTWILADGTEDFFSNNSLYANLVLTC